jgi:lipopolysaccharide export system permease protein
MKDFRFFELLGEIREESALIGAMTGPEMESSVRERRKNLSRLKVEFSKRFVFAMASLCFVLVGIPLGIRSHRKESTIGMAISLAIAMGFYLVVMLMLSLQKSYSIHPEMLIWLSPLACLTLSAWFVKRNL